MLEHKKYLIYILKNKINRKIYIGQTFTSLKNRWRNGSGYNYNKYLTRAIKKYGKNNFYYEVLDFAFTQPQADLLEILYIQRFNSANRKDGFNMTLGGSHGKPSTYVANGRRGLQAGEKHSQVLLTELKVIEILEKYINESDSQYALSKKYGVHVATINDILRHKTWKHISEKYPFKPNKKHPNRKGELAGASKLREKEVVEIIKLYNTMNYTYKEIAQMFNVKEHTIGAIIRGTNWKHINRSI